MQNNIKVFFVKATKEDIDTGYNEKLWGNSPDLYFKIEAPFNKNFVETIKINIPVKFRTYNKRLECWIINKRFLKAVTLFATEIFGDNIYSILDEENNDSAEVKSTIDIKDPYSVLFITNNAPDFIVKTVFRELAKKSHPDASKDPRTQEDFVRYREAYNKIRQQRGIK